MQNMNAFNLQLHMQYFDILNDSVQSQWLINSDLMTPIGGFNFTFWFYFFFIFFSKNSICIMHYLCIMQFIHVLH